MPLTKTPSRPSRAANVTTLAGVIAGAAAMPLLLRTGGAVRTPARSLPVVSADDRAAITTLVTEYAYALDHGRSSELAGLFAGAPEHRMRSCHCNTHHHVTNVRLEPVGADRMRGVVGIVVYGVKTGLRDKYVEFVGEYRDEYVRTQDGWRFARRELIDLADQ